MKTYFKRLLLIVFAFSPFLLLFWHFNQSVNPKLVTKNQVVKASFGLPVRLLIPAINVNANIQYLGVNSKGEMEVPNNIVDVGWLKSGALPGEIGSAVIAGHLNGNNNELGVFANLDKLKEGDKLYIEDDKDNSTVFIVREKRIYDSGYADEVFSANDKAYLNLITCDGVWDKTKKNYSKRLVIFTDIIHYDK